MNTNTQCALSIVLPAKNEEQAVGNTVSAIRELWPDAEVLVVDDGSTDATASVATAAGAKVVSHPYSKGNGAAIKTGARTAGGEILVFLDADGQHAPVDIQRLLERVEDGADMVVGARQSGSQASVGRGVANRFYNWLASYMVGHRVEDLTSGFRAVRATKFREFLHLLPNGFSYPTTSTMAFFRAGYSVEYIPIQAARRIGKSHIKIVKDGIRFLLIIFKIGTLYSPLKLFGPLALSFWSLGCVWYAYTYLMFGRFTNMSALMFSVGTLVFLMGLISEQITSLMYKDS